MFRCHAIFGLVLTVGATTLAPVAWAQDIREIEAVCGDTTAAAADRISACSQLIDDAAYTDLADYSATHMRRAQAYRDAGDTDAALGDIDTALEYDPYLYSGYMMRGEVLLEVGEAYRAIADFSVAAGLNPLEAAPYAKRGLALFANREYGEAINSLENALKYDPDLTEANRTLAWILATAPDPILRNGPRAQYLAQGLPDLEGGSPDNIILAAAFAEAGMIEDAIALYQTIAEAEPGAVVRYKRYLAANDYFDGVMDAEFTPTLTAALRKCLESGCRIGAPRR